MNLLDLCKYQYYLPHVNKDDTIEYVIHCPACKRRYHIPTKARGLNKKADFGVITDTEYSYIRWMFTCHECTYSTNEWHLRLVNLFIHLSTDTLKYHGKLNLMAEMNYLKNKKYYEVMRDILIPYMDINLPSSLDDHVRYTTFSTSIIEKILELKTYDPDYNESIWLNRKYI